jgi:hypothetical protein
MKMQRNKLNISPVLLVIILLAFCASCSTLRNEQLENVAKDWAMVIRASQVVPVYPLTEDIQPGDILLVTTPIDQQVIIFQKKGFLPLDQLLVRTCCGDSKESCSIDYYRDFMDFYNSRYGIDGKGDKIIPPGKWQTVNQDGKTNWEQAPHAAFPSYQFSVETGSGLNLAIPIQGVPFALGLMDSRNASGTVTISDTYTFGLDNYRLERIVRDWALKNRKLLRTYEPQEKKKFLFQSKKDYHFLRVVSRVYVVSGVSVTIKNDEAAGANVSAGADQPLKLLTSANNNYTDMINAINNIAHTQLPGANLKIAMASSRGVSLDETFKKPLVLGYVGFDMPILEGGRVGAPISTLSQLTGNPEIEVKLNENVFVYRLAALSYMYQALKNIHSEEAQNILTKLDALEQQLPLPKSYQYSLYTLNSQKLPQKDSKIIAGAKVEGKGFDAVLDYLGNAESTVEVLEGDLKSKADPQLSQDLQLAQNALVDIGERLNHQSVLMEAIDFVFLGN